MESYQFIKQAIQSQRPDLLRALNPRLYQGADWWESPMVPAVHLAATLAAWADPTLDGVPGARDLMTQMVAVTAARTLECDVPTYFVEPDLASAIRGAEPPEGARWTDITFPFPAGIFMLPRGFVTDAEGHSYDYVTWCHVVAGQPVTIPGGRSIAFGNEALIFSSASIASEDSPTLTKSLDANTWPLARLGESTKVQLVANLSDAEQSTINILAHLALGLLLIFEARPNLYVEGRKAARQPKAARTKGGRELWTPRRLGAGYRRPSLPKGDGTHASPRFHWQPARWVHYAVGNFKGNPDFVSSASLPRDDQGRIDWASVDEETRRRFWRFHKLRLVDEFPVGIPGE